MGIFELAAELVRTLKNDKRLIALEEARKFGQENGQISIYILSKGKEVRLKKNRAR